MTSPHAVMNNHLHVVLWTDPDRVAGWSNHEILERLELDGKRWLKCMRDAGRMIGTAVGSARSLAREAARRKSKWVVNPLPVYVDSRER